MCYTVYFKKTNQFAESVEQLEKILGVKCEPDEGEKYEDIDHDCCLCQIDLDKTLKKSNRTHSNTGYDPWDYTVHD